MDRRQFLELTGMTAGAFVLANCLSACKKDEEEEDTSPVGPTNIDFTLDLTLSANASLNGNGGFVYKDGVIVARTLSGNYIAIAQSCSHEGTTITYQGSSSRFNCSSHNSNFSESGAVINGPATRPLRQYNTALSGTSLRVFS